MIKRYLLDRYRLNGNITIDMRTGHVETRDHSCEDWRVHLIETGQNTQTGGRVKRMQPLLGGGTFMLTYGDAVSNVDPHKILRFHREHGRWATITAVRPPARFGGLAFDGDRVAAFSEKPQIGEGWINGGFMVLEPQVFDYLDGDSSVLEVDGLERLAADQQLEAYRHTGFWQCMDTLRDKYLLSRLWNSDRVPWKVWE
jgi:glucose-1-phosphate cytidylyltransferase